MQPEETLVPMVQGSLEPWMRYSDDPRYIARAPSGFSGPPSMCRGKSGRRASISGGGVQAGHSFLAETVLTADQVEELVRRIDDDGARTFPAVILDLLLFISRIERSLSRIDGRLLLLAQHLLLRIHRRHALAVAVIGRLLLIRRLSRVAL